MADKLMSISNDDAQNLDMQLNESTNRNSVKVPKDDDLSNKKTLGTGVLNSPMSPPSLR